jgi:Flp pilus assembly protein TadB
MRTGTLKEITFSRHLVLYVSSDVITTWGGSFSVESAKKRKCEEKKVQINESAKNKELKEAKHAKKRDQKQKRKRVQKSKSAKKKERKKCYIQHIYISTKLTRPPERAG